jgi:hypothetical protein
MAAQKSNGYTQKSWSMGRGINSATGKLTTVNNLSRTCGRKV